MTAINLFPEQDTFQMTKMTIEDLKWAWEVRNQESNRSQSNSMDFIPWSAQIKWWESSEISDRYVFWVNRRRAGVVTRAQDGFWSFYLSEAETKGRGLGTVMLTLYLRLFKLSGGKHLKALVKRTNIASYALHQRLGFSVRDVSTDGIYQLEWNA